MPLAPNFRVGVIESDYDGELITALDAVEYYATYGHSANIQVFHLVRDTDDIVPSPYTLRVRVCMQTVNAARTAACDVMSSRVWCSLVLASHGPVWSFTAIASSSFCNIACNAHRHRAL